MANLSGNSQQQAPRPRPIKNEDANNAAQVIDMLFPGQVAIWQTLVSIIMVFLGWYAVTVEVFFRYKFGERHFNLVKIGIAALIMGGVIQIGQLLGTPVQLPLVTIHIAVAVSLVSLRLLWWIFLVFALWHYVAIWRRNRRGETWHSQSYGISHLVRIPFFRSVDDWVLHRFIEPGICLVLAFLVYPISGPLGVWLGIAGFALFARNNLAYMQQRDMLLDLIDERIQSQYLAAALSGVEKTQTLGWTVAKVPSAIFREVEDVAKTAAAAPAPDFTEQVAAHFGKTAPGYRDRVDEDDEDERVSVNPPPANDNEPTFTAYQDAREPERERDAA